MYEAGEVDGAAIVAGREPAEVFEAAEAPLDLVTMLVDGGVVGMATLQLRLDGITALAHITAMRARKSLLS